ncbi:hypothetical protein [Nocardioides convexus]|uniref:hypothetical protein n=1 Tax=Nocardioides convexus TaxID=2712224 RepID=UPI0024181F03|nr:hypothetical protein [Nocardioides convexus]
MTMNQGATEVMLALGLQDRMAGTAYLDDSVPAKWRAAYDGVEVLSKEYPDHETLLAARADFVYGSYSSAFGDEAAGSQQEPGEARHRLLPLAVRLRRERALRGGLLRRGVGRDRDRGGRLRRAGAGGGGRGRAGGGAGRAGRTGAGQGAGRVLVRLR